MKKWIYRLLLTFAVLCGMALFGLKIISGTSDSHKRGLEQAFSQIFSGEAKFGKLVTFNIFPQFAIEIENLEIDSIRSAGNLAAEHLLIAFGPIDLLTKNRLIEDFHLKNLNVSEGVYTPLSLNLNDAGIYKDDTTKAAAFTFNGHYGDQELIGRVEMGMKPDTRTKYFLNASNPFVINVGAVQIDGQFEPYNEKGAEVSHIRFFAQMKTGKVECKLPDDKILPLVDFMSKVLGKVGNIETSADLNGQCQQLKT